MNLHKPHHTTRKIVFLRCFKEWILTGYPLREGTLLGSFLLQQKVIEQRLKFDEMMGVKLVSGVSTNDAGKQFSTGKRKKYNRKILGKIIAIF